MTMLAWRIPVLMGLALAVDAASAHKLAPTGTDEERAITEVRGGWLSGLERNASTWALHTFGESVHEEITNRIFGCDGSACDGSTSTHAPAAVLAGVRWNDDPPFRISSGEGRRTTCKVTQTIRFQTQPSCWALLFRDAEKRAANGASFTADNNAALLYRTHFGDLQFLHAMASRDAEAAAETRSAMLDWVQFNWRIISGEYTLETELSSVPIPAVKAALGKTAWTVQDLYTLGSPRLRREIESVALGSILHMLEDSFAEGHVERATPRSSQTCTLRGQTSPAPGAILEFHSYAKQDHSLHGVSDSRGALQEHLLDTPDVVEIGRELRKAFEARLEWGAVNGYFECIYALHGQARPASPGDQYRKSDA